MLFVVSRCAVCVGSAKGVPEKRKKQAEAWGVPQKRVAKTNPLSSQDSVSPLPPFLPVLACPSCSCPAPFPKLVLSFLPIPLFSVAFPSWLVFLHSLLFPFPCPVPLSLVSFSHRHRHQKMVLSAAWASPPPPPSVVVVRVSRPSFVKRSFMVLQCALDVVRLWCLWQTLFRAWRPRTTHQTMRDDAPTARVCHRTHYTVTSLPMTDRAERTNQRIRGLASAQHGLRVLLINGRAAKNRKTQRDSVRQKNPRDERGQKIRSANVPSTK